MASATSVPFPNKAAEHAHLKTAITDFGRDEFPVPGVQSSTRLDSLCWQMIASMRRRDYARILAKRPVSPRRADPNDPIFDAERAAVYHFNNSNIDEAVWLIFLATHFGKHGKYGWRRLKDVYSGLGQYTWTWTRVSKDVSKFRQWLEKNRSKIGGAFGNHRKYESLSGITSIGTGAVVESYVAWINTTGGHQKKISSIVRSCGNNPHDIFDAFYRDMKVTRFGRLGKFDFLTLLGKLGFAPLDPGSAYLKGATGPLPGARLLFTNSTDSKIAVSELQERLDALDQKLNIGMQAMEDSLCNWQKSPDIFKHFIG